MENVPSYTITSSNPDEPTTRFAPHTSRFVDFYKFANDGLYEENMTIDEAIIPLSPDEWVYDRLEDDVINSTRSINGNHEELLDTTFRATVVPRITFDSNRIGYYDYDEEHGSDIAAESSAVLFDVSILYA